MEMELSLLVISEFLGLFVDTFYPDGKYSFHYSENLQQPIQMQLSKKIKMFYQYFAPFLKSTSNFEHFQKKDAHSS